MAALRGAKCGNSEAESCPYRRANTSAWFNAFRLQFSRETDFGFLGSTVQSGEGLYLSSSAGAKV